ncbi:hypothetical protein ILUMI_19643 [Ignelater luminosus]|uniref:Cytochrome P450 n=1 Tax=Ignelater luminosus TaxID=2038154 RepID=A0A8K0G5A5_IGNLU|nr:hypothetical protein ILUMI_19643 [Ignelater luminosus]
MWNIILLLFFSLTIVIILTKHLKTRAALSQIPGPHGKFLIGILLNIMDTPENIWSYVRHLSGKYYPIYKYWILHIPVVTLVCPDDIEIVFSSTKHSAKGDVYKVLLPWLGTGLLTSKGLKWQNRRKILTPAFHFNILQQFIGIFTEESQLLVKQLQIECEKPYTNIVPIITQCTLRAICETAMGTKLEEDAKSQEYTNAIFRLGEILFHRLTRIWYYYGASFRLTSLYREQNKLLKILHGFSRSVIKNRKDNFKEPIDLVTLSSGTFSPLKRQLAMLDLLISAKYSGEPIDDEGIREEVDTFMFEGHDTTTACISFTLLLLACHKDIQEKVVQELQDVFGDSNRAPTFQDLQNLRYLERVLKESLRFYPSVPFLSRVSEEEIHTYTGYTIPSNTIMHIHIYDLHHNPQLYPEPEKFDPDRFLPENSAGRHPFAYIPFSAGPRNCIGQKFAFLEIKTIVSYILRNFVLEPVDQPSDITMITHFVLKTRNGIRVKFLKRQTRLI